MTTQHEHNKNRSTIKKQHHFSIRKLSGGIASIAIGATLFLGAGHTYVSHCINWLFICCNGIQTYFFSKTSTTWRNEYF
ncbi:YSIRK-type signal peptide-containing protein [Mammaliicoccus sciuri]|nr:YSIRK-type signal peptide-containing protein [Mammaliicoccus sciuri]